MIKRQAYKALISAMLALAGAACSADSRLPANSPATNANAASQASNANVLASPQKPEGETAQQNPRPRLLGTYTISEVHHDGMTTMVSAANKTEITFSATGSFVRVSMKNNRQDHRDSGQYRIEAPDQLVLTINLSRGKIVLPPVEKRHKFELADEGNELKMTSTDGKSAVFRRTKGLTGP